MTSPLRRYISAFPRCTVTDSSCIAQRAEMSISFDVRGFTLGTFATRPPPHLDVAPHFDTYVSYTADAMSLSNPPCDTQCVPTWPNRP